MSLLFASGVLIACVHVVAVRVDRVALAGANISCALGAEGQKGGDGLP